MDQELANAAACAPGCVWAHSPDGSTFVREWCHGRQLESLTSSQKSDSVVKRYIFYLNNISAKFHPSPICKL